MTNYVYFFRLSFRRAGVHQEYAGTYTSGEPITGGQRFNEFVTFMAERYGVGESAIRIEALNFLHQV